MTVTDDVVAVALMSTGGPDGAAVIHHKHITSVMLLYLKSSYIYLLQACSGV